MENGNDYIEKLYSEKFDKFEIQASDADWSMLSSKLGKANFLKFSFTTFNAFYLGVFLAFAGTASYLGVSNINQSNKIETLQNKIEILEQQNNKNETTPSIIDSLSAEKQEYKQGVKAENKAVESAIKNELPKNIEENKVTNLPPTNLSKDSVIVKPDTTAVKKANAQKINRIKKTVFVKQDKVIIGDTVRIRQKTK